jgi:ribose transport system ATP-binding protein
MHGMAGLEASNRVGTRPVSLKLSGIVKSFGPVKALKGVDLETVEGEVHAIVGENGAGKSTLMAIAAADLAPDQGSVEIYGVPLRMYNPNECRSLGLALVHQHPALLPALKVAENFMLTQLPHRRPSFTQLRRWTREELADWAPHVDPDTRVSDLSLADQHLVGLCMALAGDPRVLILDEPTEHMDQKEVEQLFAGIKRLIEKGCTVVYISHRIHEVKAIANRISVIRDGEIRGVFDASSVTEPEIINLVVGRTLAAAFPDKCVALDRTAGPILSIRNFAGAGFRNISLDVWRGEIVGLAGIEGNGQREFLRGAAGLEATTGEIEISGHTAPVISYVPRDRHREALLKPLSVAKNIGLASLKRNSGLFFMSPSREAEAVDAQIRALSIKAPAQDALVANLSGGNQQKVVIGRCLMSEPNLLLADEPSQGVDAGARFDIYSILRKASGEGTAVVVASSDALELAGLCDRVLIFSRGQIVRELSGDEVTEANITGAALTSTTLRADKGTKSRETWLARFMCHDLAPSVILILAFAALGLYTALVNPLYLSSRNATNLFLLMAPLIFVSLGQQAVLLVAGIDLSVGPLAGFTVVILSFFLIDDMSTQTMVSGAGIALVAALGVGLLNWFLIRKTMISAVIATLATYMSLHGASLWLRDIPRGLITRDIQLFLKAKIGIFPVAFLVAVVVALALELALRRSLWGLAIRAVGSSETNARRATVNVERTFVGAYVLCAIMAFIGGILLMSLIGIGDPNAGLTYTLTSITAVVLGGASLFGGRGSFVGALMGAALIQQSLNVTTFLNLGAAWQYLLVGLLTFAAALLFSRFRKVA